jgi:hypothetical protein
VAETVVLVEGCPEEEPGRPCSGKFLQLTWGGADYLLFAAADLHRYHTGILGAFVAAHGVDHHWETPEWLALDDPALVVRGGGRFRVDALAGVLEVWDASQAYGRFDAAALPGQLASAAHPWGRLALRVS